MDSLQRARALYEGMDFKQYAIVVKPKTYTMGQGKLRMQVIYEDGMVEILRGDAAAGCDVEPHTHEQVENLLVYRGSAVVSVGEVEHHLMPGMSVNIPPNTVHHTKTKNGCKLFIARMPPLKGIY